MEIKSKWGITTANTVVFEGLRLPYFDIKFIKIYILMRKIHEIYHIPQGSWGIAMNS